MGECPNDEGLHSFGHRRSAIGNSVCLLSTLFSRLIQEEIEAAAGHFVCE
jgi:hypothetical protein